MLYNSRISKQKTQAFWICDTMYGKNIFEKENSGNPDITLIALQYRSSDSDEEKRITAAVHMLLYITIAFFLQEKVLKYCMSVCIVSALLSVPFWTGMLC